MKLSNNSPARKAFLALALVVGGLAVAGLGNPLGRIFSFRVDMTERNAAVRVKADNTRDHNSVRCKNLSTTPIYVGGAGLTPLNGYSICNDSACGNETAITIDGIEMWMLQPAIYDGGTYEVGDGTAARNSDYDWHCGEFTDAGSPYDAGACPSFADLVTDIECLQGR